MILLSDGLELVVAHELSVAFSGFDARRLHSSDVVTLSSDLMIRFLAEFHRNSSTRLAHWCAHQSGPIPPIRSCFGALFLSLSLLTPPPTFVYFAFPLPKLVFSLAFSLSLLPFSFFRARLCHMSPLWTVAAHCFCRLAILCRATMRDEYELICSLGHMERVKST